VPESLSQFWWVLPGLAYFILLAFLMRRGLWSTVGRKIHLAAICVFILLIPSMHWAGGYPFAVLTVLNVLLFVAAENRLAKTSPRPSD
jgi:hypothetical protein